MTQWLLDANVLIALTTADHVHHRRAVGWYDREVRSFATCPMTQSALLRFQLRFGKEVSPSSAWELLRSLIKLPRHEFWPDEIDFLSVSTYGLTGHKQITDAYLAALAKHRKGRLATLDIGLAKLHSDIATLIPS